MGLKRIVAPAVDPLSLAETKKHLRVEHDEDNALISNLIGAATEFLDGPGGHLGRALVDQTWDFYLDRFPGDPCSIGYLGRRSSRHHRPAHDISIEIPLPPLIDLIGVFYLDTNGSEQTFAGASYVVDDADQPARVVLTSGIPWPSTKDCANAVRIRFRAGFLDQGVSPAVDAVPASIKAAMLLQIGDLYANRESQVIEQRLTQILNPAAELLLRRHRVYLSLA